MRAARCVVGEGEVADPASADRHALTGNVEPGSLFWPVLDDESALAQLSLGRFAIDEYGSERGVVVHSPSFRSASIAAT